MALRFLVAVLLLGSVLGQQYVGEVIPNSLPTTPGSEITFFNIKDANGGNTTLINYFSLPLSTGKRQDPTKVQRAIVMFHGEQRDPATYFSTTWAAFGDAAKINPAVSEETVAILTPYMPNGDDKDTGYPWNDGQPPGEGSNTSVLVWQGSGWASGERNQYPHDQQTVSSFDVVDQLLQYFDNKTLYPNLHQIVVAGHSLGAQMSGRYAAVSKELNLATPVVYWQGNPNSFLWFNSSRPESTANCPNYNDWKEGLASYTNVYERDFVQDGRDDGAVFARYTSRDIAYARGLDDHGDTSSDCAPETTGPDRGERFYNFMTWFSPDSGDTVDYVENVGHSAPEMFSAESGLYRLFIDNFNGNGSRHADFGPRQVPGDDPHPASN